MRLADRAGWLAVRAGRLAVLAGHGHGWPKMTGRSGEARRFQEPGQFLLSKNI